ncbi:unnamed protein product [Mytilus coruscus]|uniref:Reverse transcriptase domain-containing protein n=1 Tax=Mytilus coruscus TaxID=42192 RepID=A0A6J8A1S5_MYTCO|nr:unnamed protein product [Mytilus coruscus]
MPSDIICIQEHWLYEFQKQILGPVLPNMDMHIRCSDTNEEIGNFKLPRGKGAVTIAWKNHLTPSVQEIQSGNNRIEIKANVKQRIVKPNFARQFKLQWKDIDSESFNSLINEELTQYNIEKHSLEENIQFLCNCLKKAAAVAAPSKIIKLKGPKFKASPTTLGLLQICKEKYHLWKSHGKHDDHFKSDKILAQRNLRKQMRREQYIDRAQFYKEVMDNPSNEMFHRLIRRNRGNRNKDSMCIIENGELQYSATDQTQSFSKYFEDLALPKDKGYDPEFLDLCNVRHKIIQQLCEQENITTKFSTQNICDAIKQLHSGKAIDELGLAAEHFKNSPAIVTQFLTDCFHTIMKDKLIPLIFKSGIVIPVLKKGKNPMMMDNYRGIAITPVVSKLFECTILPSLTQNFKQLFNLD